MTDKTTAIMERVRELCEDKSKFIKPTHGTCCTCQRCGHPNDGECICLETYDLHLEHLMRAIPDMSMLSCGCDVILTYRYDMMHYAGYKLTLTLEQNLEQNKVLRDFIYELICNV